jgi:hypothetical protein
MFDGGGVWMDAAHRGAVAFTKRGLDRVQARGDIAAGEPASVPAAEVAAISMRQFRDVTEVAAISVRSVSGRGRGARDLGAVPRGGAF